MGIKLKKKKKDLVAVRTGRGRCSAGDRSRSLPVQLQHSWALAGTHLSLKRPSLLTVCMFFTSWPEHKPGLGINCL